MMVKTIFIVLTVLLFGGILQAQPSSGVYQLKSSQKFYFRSKFQYDEFGNIYNLNVSENGETVITKINSCGTKIWSKKISPVHQNSLQRAVDLDGSQFMFIGNCIYLVLRQYYYSQFGYKTRFLVHCLATNGALKWSKILPLKKGFRVFYQFNGFVDTNSHLILAFYSNSYKNGIMVDSLSFNVLRFDSNDGKISAQNTWLETNYSGFARKISIPIVKVNYNKSEIEFFRYTTIILEKTVLELSSLKLKGHYTQSTYNRDLVYRKAFNQNNGYYYLTDLPSTYAYYSQILKFSDASNTVNIIDVDKKYYNESIYDVLLANNNLFWIISSNDSNMFIDGYLLNGLESKRFKNYQGRISNQFDEQVLDVYKNSIVYSAEIHAANFANTQNFNIINFENHFCGDTLPPNWKLKPSKTITLNWTKDDLKVTGRVFFKDTTFDMDNSDLKIKKICGYNTWLPSDFLPNDTFICSSTYTIKPNLDSINAKCVWSTGDTTKAINVESSGYYYLTLNNGFCSIIDSMKITLLNKPLEQLKKSYTICRNDSLELKIENAEYFEVITPTLDTLLLSGSKKSYYFIELGAYQLRTNGNALCPLNYNFEIKRSKVKVALPPDTLVCADASIIVSHSTNFISYWYVNGWLVDSLKNTYQLNHAEDTVVALKLIDSFGCISYDSMRVLTYSNLKVNYLFDSTFICTTDSFLVHIVSDGGKRPYKYYYNTEEFAKDTVKVDYKSKRIAPYRFTVKDDCGQDLVFSTAVPDNNALRFNVHFQGRDTLLLGAKIEASATLNLGSIEWFINRSFFQMGNEISYEPNDTGIYSLKALAKNTYCLDSAVRKYYVTQPFLYVPNVFSPNNDGSNENWKVVCYKCSIINFDIYNRWGQRIFSGQNDSYWNGRQENGSSLPIDMYLAIINYQDEIGRIYIFSTPVYIYR